MSWKPSKRQALLKKRLINSSQIYWQTSRQLDNMLLKMLHRNNIYTPDDLHNKYINSHQVPRLRQILPAKDVGHPSSDASPSSQIDQALVNLSSALVQLKHVIDQRYVK